MIALESNILAHARRAGAPFHRQAKSLLAGPRRRPTTLEAALEDLQSLVDSPALVLLGEGSAHLGTTRQALVSGRATGNMVHDAHIAAVLFEHGVHEIWTADRDFARFPGLKVHDPFH